MKFAKTLTASAVLSALMLGNAGAADRPENLRQIFGDLNAAAGLEVAVPYFNERNRDSAGYPQSIALSWRVYAVGGSTTPIHTSVAKAFATPAMPPGCTTDPAWAINGKWINWDMDVRLARRQDELKWNGAAAVFNAGAKRAHIAVNFKVECYGDQGYQEASVGVVYSGRLDAAQGGVEWMKVYANSSIFGLNGVDMGTSANGVLQNTDLDLINDAVMITRVYDTAGGEKAQVIFVNSANGGTTTPQAMPAARIYPLGN